MPSAPKWVFDVFERLLSPKLPLMEVTNTELLSQTVKKIRFEGDFKRLNFKVGDFMDFRVSDTEVRRYTASHVSTENGVLELIVHLHGKAPGSQYMDQLAIGDKVNISQPRGHRCYDESLERYVIFGDETSLALACSFLPFLIKNKHPFEFYFELEEVNKKIPELLGLENFTVFPKDGSFRNSDWINNLPLIQTSDWQHANFVLTGNVKSVQTFRKSLKNRTKGKIFSQGYWLEGKRGL